MKIVADKARETWKEIKLLRKTMPQFTRAQKDELETKIKGLQDKWWLDVKGYMVKSPVPPPPRKPDKSDSDHDHPHSGDDDSGEDDED